MLAKPRKEKAPFATPPTLLQNKQNVRGVNYCCSQASQDKASGYKFNDLACKTTPARQQKTLLFPPAT